MQYADVLEEYQYTPDFYIFKKKDSKDSIVGTYYVMIYSKTYSSYSLLYYTNNKNAINSYSIVSLNEREIIKDILTKESPYRVFSFNADYEKGKEEDIRILLTPIKGEFEIYVFLPDKELNYNVKNNTFSDYTWSTLTTFSDNFIIINKDDPNYVSKGKYLIAVSLLQENKASQDSFYIGASDESSGFILQENIPVLSSLNKDNYKSQLYNIVVMEKVNISVDLSVYSGAIYIEIRNMNYSLISAMDCLSDCSVNIDSYELSKSTNDNKYLNKYYNIKIIIVDVSEKKSRFSMESKYHLIVRPEKQRSIELLSSGITKHDSVNLNKNKYYYIYIPKEKQINVNVFFNGFDGKVYGKLINKTNYSNLQLIELMPNNSDNDEDNLDSVKDKDNIKFKLLKFESKYWNYYSSVSKEDTKICEEYCTLLINVQGNSDEYNNNTETETDITNEYDISVSYDVAQISFNKQIVGSTVSGEYVYYRIELKKSKKEIENLIFALSCSEGDVDLLINYGEKFPELIDSDFISKDLMTNIIQINKESDYFKSKNITSISGVYTIGVYSYTNSTYTLSISPLKELILPVSNYYPSSCKAKKGESCYFSYLMEDIDEEFIYNKSLGGDKLDSIKALMYINYHYGSSEAYAKLFATFKGDELSKLPTKEDFDSNKTNIFSNIKDRNYIEIEIKRSEYEKLFEYKESFYKEFKDIFSVGKNSINTNGYLFTPYVTLNVKCLSDCFITLHASIKSSQATYFVDPYFDNLIYFPKDFKKSIYYYNYGSSNVYDIQIEAVKGSMNFTVSYSKDSYFNYFDISNKLNNKNITDTINKYESQFSEEKQIFVLDSQQGNQKRKNIQTNDNQKLTTLISAKSSNISDTAILIRAIVHKKWIKIQPGSDNYLSPIKDETDDNNDSENNFFNVYFDYVKEYKSVSINVECSFLLNCNLEAYGEFEYLERNKNNKTIGENDKFPFKEIDHNLKDKMNYASNNNTMLKNLKLFVKSPENSEYKVIYKLKIVYNKNLNSDNTINITLSPVSNSNESFIYLEPGKIIHEYIDSELKQTNLYELTKSSTKDNSINIIISKCEGFTTYEIYDDFTKINKNETINNNKNVSSYIEKGRTYIEIRELKDINNLYLKVLLSNNLKENINDKQNIKSCAEYSVSYTSYVNSQEYIEKVNNPSLDKNNNYKFLDEEILIYNPDKNNLEFYSSEYDINFASEAYRNEEDYYLFYTKDKSIFYSNLDSICFLTSENINQKIVKKKIMKAELKDITNSASYYNSYYKSKVYSYNLDFLSSGTYYVNIMTVTYTGSFYAYRSTQINIESSGISIIFVVISIALSILVFVLYYLYTKTRKRLKLERNDINNMASTNKYKTDNELKEMKNLDKVKYSNLSEQTSEI